MSPYWIWVYCRARKFCLEKFCPFQPQLSWAILSCKCFVPWEMVTRKWLVHVNPNVIFTTLGGNFTKYFCNVRVYLGWVKFLSSKNFQLYCNSNTWISPPWGLKLQCTCTTHGEDIYINCLYPTYDADQSKVPPGQHILVCDIALWLLGNIMILPYGTGNNYILQVTGSVVRA